MCIGYNIRNNYWETLFQQGLKMLGINNTFNSYSSFDPMSMNRSLFNYNVNYDAMAGIAVANAVFGVAGQAYSTSRAEKQAEKQEYANNQTRLEQIEKEISDLNKTDIAEEVETRSKTDSEVKSKQTAFNTADSNLQSAEDYIKNNESAYRAAKAKADVGKDLTSDEKQLIIDYKAKLDKQTELKTAKEVAKKALDDAKSALETKIKNEIQDKKNDLKAEKEKLQKEVNSYEDSKVKTKLASSDEVYNAKIKDIKKYDDKNDDGSFTKKDVYSAIKRFIKAADGSPEKLKVAKELYYSHNHCGNDFDAQTIRYAQRAFDYINEYKKEA